MKNKLINLLKRFWLPLVIVVLMGVSAYVSGRFFSQYFIVNPLFIRTREFAVKRTSAQEYAYREAQMIKEASQWVLDYQQDEATRLKFSEDVKNIMDK